MEIPGLIAIILLGGSMSLVALAGFLLIPVENRLHTHPTDHH